MMHKIFVSTHPFGYVAPPLLYGLCRHNIKLSVNPFGRKIRREELIECLRDKDGYIAGTEKIDAEVLDQAPNLKIIARVGIGLDNIDLQETAKRGITVTYTPDAPTRSVAELTVANMVNLARSIPQTDFAMKAGKWQRIIGHEVSGHTIGIIGFGRVGKSVARLLHGWNCTVIANDIVPKGPVYGVNFCDKEKIYRNADIITLHVPLTPLTRNLINENTLAKMKKSACLINTSRGAVVDEDALYAALKGGIIAAAAIDVFTQEPYSGILRLLPNVVLTCHSGSCTRGARWEMENSAVIEILRHFRGQEPLRPVPLGEVVGVV